jgi:hypothetical protein
MKVTHLILALLTFFHSGLKANKIDSLKTGKEVENFIASLFQEKYGVNHYTFYLKKPDSKINYMPCDSTIQRESEIWNKIDFNQDGFTDLFTIIYRRNSLDSNSTNYIAYVVIDKGKNQFDLNEIPDYFIFNCFAVKPIVVNNIPCLFYRHYKTETIIDTLPDVDTLEGKNNIHIEPHFFEVGKTDTLIYKFGSFIELNLLNNIFPEIDAIQFKTISDWPYGPNCSFSLNISKNGKARYIREGNLDTPFGNFNCTINPIHLKEIKELIKYLDVNKLENDYSASATDRGSGELKIYFSNGAIKKINDYGLEGTLGLRRLYDLFFDLRFNQIWK